MNLLKSLDLGNVLLNYNDVFCENRNGPYGQYEFLIFLWNWKFVIEKGFMEQEPWFVKLWVSMFLTRWKEAGCMQEAWHAQVGNIQRFCVFSQWNLLQSAHMSTFHTIVQQTRGWQNCSATLQWVTDLRAKCANEFCISTQCWHLRKGLDWQLSGLCRLPFSDISKSRHSRTPGLRSARVSHHIRFPSIRSRRTNLQKMEEKEQKSRLYPYMRQRMVSPDARGTLSRISSKRFVLTALERVHSYKIVKCMTTIAELAKSSHVYSVKHSCDSLQYVQLHLVWQSCSVALAAHASCRWQTLASKVADMIQSVQIQDILFGHLPAGAGI